MKQNLEDICNLIYICFFTLHCGWKCPDIFGNYKYWNIGIEGLGARQGKIVNPLDYLRCSILLSLNKYRVSSLAQISHYNWAAISLIFSYMRVHYVLTITDIIVMDGIKHFISDNAWLYRHEKSYKMSANQNSGI